MTKHQLMAAFNRQGIAALERRNIRTAAGRFQCALKFAPESLMDAHLAVKDGGTNRR